ncbi:metalloregulator ArsR/SmtB family transcription factor [Candidatus Deferrimicrobium sp.]|jgi:ArsR family transcriptional regulator|uniref:ArsR/SmtB family transcription factor n=1 Tax=Candidatus Deferrimicrobium sp. TaxID=3060586 RepID=UPI002ED9DB33
MDQDRAYERAELIKAFAHPTRLQILAELAKGTRCVTDMEDLLPVTQVNISQHLTVLRNARLVDFVQDGALRCYYLSRPKLVEGVLALLSADHPVLRKTREQIDREKARGGKEKVAVRG